MADPLRVLVVESHRGLASVAASTLEAAGHEVHRCFGPDDMGFPCVGMQGEPCPVERGVDVVFLHRAGSTARPTPLEDGVLCALREQVPVVEARAQTAVVDPFGAYVTAWVDPKATPVEAVEAAARGRFEAVGAAVLERIAPLLEHAGLGPDDVSCEVVREGDSLQVLLRTSQGVPALVAQSLAVRALDAVRTSGLARGQVGVHVLDAVAGAV
jgi:hypothetical protein